MIYLKEGIEEKVKKWNSKEVHIVTDFDRTITDFSTPTSWSLLSRSGLTPNEYVFDRQALYENYHKYENDPSIDEEFRCKMMKEWFEGHIALFIKHRINKEIFERIIYNEMMQFREKGKEFLELTYRKNIPVIIISAGLKVFIDSFLQKNGCLFENTYIVSNELVFDDGGIPISFCGETIHMANKSEVSLPDEIRARLDARPNIILLGDGISDIKMVSEDKREYAVKIGFLNEEDRNNVELFKQKFDIVIAEEDASFAKVIELLNQLQEG